MAEVRVVRVVMAEVREVAALEVAMAAEGRGEG